MNATLNVRRYWVVLAVLLALTVGIFVGVLASHRVGKARLLSFGADPKPLSSPSPESLSNSFAQVAARVIPAVVNIDTESTIHFGKVLQGPGGGQGLFNQFFHLGPGSTPHSMQQKSLGSGVILDKHGYILTNYHVIMQDDGQPVDQIRVHLQGASERDRAYVAKIVGYDKWTDLAVVKINGGRALPTAELGDSSTMRVGDWVLAIGSPFGLNATVTAGIISAKGRQIDDGMQDEFKRFLQTDAAINPGNSGGPLVSLAGQVIGINTAIATERGVYDGVGFAIPSAIVRKVYNSIIQTGSVRRGAIGVSFRSDQSRALLHSLGATHGVVVESVAPGSPAALAGVRLGDVITSINSKPVESGSDLLGIVSNAAPGAKLRVDYLRNGKSMSCNMTVADWNKIVAETTGNNVPAPPAVIKPAEPIGRGSLGLSVQDINPNKARRIAARLQLGKPEGVTVDHVTPGGFAGGLGIEPYDVILSMDHHGIHSAADFNRAESQLKPGRDVLFLIARRTRSGYSTFFFAGPFP